MVFKDLVEQTSVEWKRCKLTCTQGVVQMISEEPFDDLNNFYNCKK